MTDSILKAKEQIGQRLMTQGAVNAEDIETALQQQQSGGHHRLLGEILVDMGSCTEAQVALALAESYGVPYAPVRPEICDPEVFDMLPGKFIEENLVLPMFCVNNRLTVALCEPANLFLIDQIKQITDCDIQGVCATAKDIQSTIRAFCPADKTYITHEVCYEGAGSAMERSCDSLRKDDVTATDTPPMIQLVEHLVCQAVASQASHVYFEPDHTGVRVRFRIDGELVEKTRFNGLVHETIASHFRSVANMAKPEPSQPQDGLIRLGVNGRTVEFRIFILPGAWGEVVSLQASDPERLLYGLESLGLTLDTLTRLQRIIRKPQGLVLVAGPAASGKKTALYAMLRECRDDKVQICTVEDTVLCRVPGMNQFAVPWGSAQAPATTLYYVMRQHPDIIMVNDIQDRQTALLCMKAAATGMRVLAGIQAPDAMSAIDRLVKLGVPAYGLHDSLLGILTLRLAPKICAHCKEPDIPSEGTRSYLEHMGYPLKGTVFRGAGCGHCRQTGYTGHIGIQELTEMDESFGQCVEQINPSDGFRSWYGSKRKKSLLKDGIDKATAGLISLNDVIYFVANR